MQITIEQLKTASSDITAELNSLLAQLNPGLKALKAEDIRRVIEGRSNRFIAARDAVNNRIIGMLTLVVVDAVSAKKGLLEGLVVDKNYQGKGIGTKLIAKAISQARKERIVFLDLTSSPKRIAANRLYRHLGFRRRNTNAYRIKL